MSSVNDNQNVTNESFSVISIALSKYKVFTGYLDILH